MTKDVQTETAVTTITLNMTALEAAYQGSSDESSRYYLCGVYVERFENRIRFSAADGHIMVQTLQENETADFKSFIMPNETIEKVLKAIKGHGKRVTPVVTLEGNSVKIECYGETQSISFAPIDGIWPDTERVKPSKHSAIEVVGFKPELVAKIGKAAKIMNNGNDMALKMTFGSDAVSAIKVEGPVNFYAVMMPYRV